MNTINKQSSKLESQKSEKSEKSEKRQKEKVEEIVKKPAEKDFPYSFATSVAPAADSSLSKQGSQKKIKINYGIPVAAESSKSIQNVEKKPAKKLILSSSQLADRMLFGIQPKKTDAAPQQEKPAVTEVVSPNNRKRILSMPKITFTYSSREKDGRIESHSPAFKAVIASSQAQKAAVPQNKQPVPSLRALPIARVQSTKKLVKKQLQSTFGSTQMNDNSNQDYMMHVKSAKDLPRAFDMPNQRERVGMNPFTQRPNMPIIMSPRGQQAAFGKPINKIDN